MTARIRINESFARSLAVMHILLSSEELQNKITGNGTIYVEAYQNGREQGITIWDTRKQGLSEERTYFVAEHRNSDSIVVYKGTYAMQSVSENAYHHQHSFNNSEEAAEWIIEQLIAENTLQET